MDIKKLFRGVVVVFDDRVNDNQSSIWTIIDQLEKEHYPVVSYTSVPDSCIIDSISSASFVILDWDYTGKILKEDSDEGERITAGDTLTTEDENKLINFIRCFLTNAYVPLFLFTDFSVNKIKEILIKNELYSDGKPSRIFIKNKDEVKTSDSLFASIEEWLKSFPPIYVLKEWEKALKYAKNHLFLEFDNYSSKWVGIIWKTLVSDGTEYEKEFGDFLTRNCINRITGYSFEKDMLDESGTALLDNTELRSVIQGERFIYYSDRWNPNQAFTGDLFCALELNPKTKENEEVYYLVIDAQCSLMNREKAEETYDSTTMHCVKGYVLSSNEVSLNGIVLKKNGDIEFDAQTKISLQDLETACSNGEERHRINQMFQAHRNKYSLCNGAFLERANTVVISCIDGKDFRFEMDIFQKKFGDLKSNRIGRLLPPYITRIQQKAASYLIREGIMPTPKELFLKS